MTNAETILAACGVWLVLVLHWGALQLTVQQARAVALAGTVAAGCWLQIASPIGQAADDPRARLELPQLSTEGGFVSSSACKSCHPREYSTWHDSFHRTMTQLASPQTVKGDFREQTLEALGHKVQLRRDGDDHWVNVAATDWERRTRKVERLWKRVVLITGSHHNQVYWVPGEFDGELRAMPFVYHLEDERWIPREGSFVAPRDGFGFWRWNDICIQCHATHGTTRLNYEAKRMESRVAELGIACEACHGPAAEHVRVHSDAPRRHLPNGRDDVTIVQPANLSSKAASHVCASCHSAFRRPVVIPFGERRSSCGTP